MEDLIRIEDVKDRLVMIRGELSLLDRDVAALYGVETRVVNQAVRNNPAKFPAGFCVQLNAGEFADWKSKILISNLPDEERSAIRMGMRRAAADERRTQTRGADRRQSLDRLDGNDDRAQSRGSQDHTQVHAP